MTSFILYLLLIFLSLILELFIVKLFFPKPHNKKFSLTKYLILVSFPLTITFLFILNDPSLLYWFIVSLVIGPLLEWLGGYFFYQITGIKFWTYNYFSLTGYTSSLVILFWGMAGVIIGLLSKI